MKYLIIPILFILFFISSIFINNINEVSIEGFVIAIAISSIITIGSFFLLQVLIKNYVNTSLITSFLIIFFFEYFSMYDVFKGIELYEFVIGRHFILFPLITVGLILCIYIFLKSKKNFKNLAKISFAIILFLVVSNAINVSFIYASLDFEKFPLDNSSNDLSSTAKKYNVYHLVLDEYPGTQAMKKYFNFDNSDFESFLTDRGFYVVKNSFSNYRISVESIPSILNMDYHNYLQGLDDKSRKLTVKHLGEHNSVVKNFENLGYKTIYFANEYYIGKSPSSDVYCQMNLGEFLIIESIIMNSPLGLLNDYLDPYSTDRFAKNRLCIFNELKLLDDKYEAPIFVQAHVIMPHSPYIFDKNGNVVNYGNIENKLEERSAAMLEQVQFANILTKDFVDTILSNNSENSIIIIQSDHGYRTGGLYDNSFEKDHLEQYYSNFAAYYFPNKDIEFPEPLTPVNTFRILFNTYFDGNYEILENQMFSVRGTEYVEHTEILLDLVN